MAQTQTNIQEVQTEEQAIDLANEINRYEAALKSMKSHLKAYVSEHGAVNTGEEIWDFYESISWNFDADGLKEIARNIGLEGENPWEVMTIRKPKLDKLGWEESFIESMGKKKVIKRFTSRKSKK